MKTILIIIVTLFLTSVVYSQTGTMLVHTNAETSSFLIADIDSITFSVSPLPTKGLVVYYPFNGNANDESGNGNHCTATNCTLVPDRFGNTNGAYYFNGNNSICSTSTGAMFSVSKVTLCAWVKTYAYTKNNPRIIAVGPTGTVQHSYSMCWHNINASPYGRFMFYGNNMSPEQYYSKSLLPIDSANWHHVALTFDSTVVSFYLDGILDTSHTVTGSLQQLSSGILRIGNNYNNNDPFKGVIDDVLIYNRSLNSTEILGIYQGRGLK